MFNRSTGAMSQTYIVNAILTGVKNGLAVSLLGEQPLSARRVRRASAATISAIDGEPRRRRDGVALESRRTHGRAP